MTESSRGRGARGTRADRWASWEVGLIAGALVVVMLAAPTVAMPAGAGSGARAGPIITQCATGTFASDPVYDPVTHNLYVLNQGSAGGTGNISVVSPKCHVVGTVTLPKGADPIAAAFSPQNNHIYVADLSLNCVYIILGTTITAKVGHGYFNAPTAIAWDPGDSIMLVSNFGWSNVSTISGTAFGGSIPTGVEPSGIAYDPFFNSILISNYGASNVTVISSATYPYNSSHSSIAYMGGPWDIVYDPADQLDYIADSASNAVTVVDGIGIVVATIPVGHGPLTEAFNQAKLTVYVANEYSGNVTILKGLAHAGGDRVGHGTDPLGLAYDDYTGTVFVAGSGTGVLYEVR
jgi:DNA-binding beta-propeller fold protein YncE